MGFAKKDVIESVSDLVNPPEKEVQEEPEHKNTVENEKFTPINPDVDKSQLGQPSETEIHIVEKPIIPLIIPTLGLEKGAGIAKNLNFKRSHIVNIREFSSTSKNYTFLVHCDTCGFQARINNKATAESIKQKHLNAHSR